MTEEMLSPPEEPAAPGTTEVLRKGFRGSVAIMAGRVIAGIAGIVFSIYTLRYLSMEDYAAWGVLRRSFLPLGVMISSFGLNASLLRFVPELLEKRANAALRRLLFTAGAIKLLAVAALAAFLILAYGPVARVLDLPAAIRPILPLAVAYLAVLLLTDFLTGGVLPSFLDQTFYSVVTMISVIGYTAATVWALQRGYGLDGVMWSQVVFLGLGLLALVYRTLRLVGPRLHAPPGTSMNIRRRVRRFAGFSFLIGLGATMRNAAVDVLVISRYLGDADVALYAFASGIALMAFRYTPMANVGTVLTPIMAREYSRTENPEKLVFFFQLSTKLVLHTSIPLLVGLFIFLPNVITDIYQRPDYLPAVTVGRMFLGYMMVKLLTRPFAILYSTYERPDLSLYALFLLGLNLFLLFILVPRYGILGAALSTCGLAPLYYFYHIFILRVFAGLRLSVPVGALVQFAINIAISAVLALFLQRYLHGLFFTLIGLAVFLLCYVLVAKLNRIFDGRERALLSRTIGFSAILL